MYSSMMRDIIYILNDIIKKKKTSRIMIRFNLLLYTVPTLWEQGRNSSLVSVWEGNICAFPKEQVYLKNKTL